jgi:hypothetical protein
MEVKVVGDHLSYDPDVSSYMDIAKGLVAAS